MHVCVFIKIREETALEEWCITQYDVQLVLSQVCLSLVLPENTQRNQPGSTFLKTVTSGQWFQVEHSCTQTQATEPQLSLQPLSVGAVLSAAVLCTKDQMALDRAQKQSPGAAASAVQPEQDHCVRGSSPFSPSVPIKPWAVQLCTATTLCFSSLETSCGEQQNPLDLFPYCELSAVVCLGLKKENDSSRNKRASKKPLNKLTHARTH